MATVIPSNGGVFDVSTFPPGEEFIIPAGTTGNITFNGDNDFTVTINEDLNVVPDNTRFIAFGSSTEPTVNIGVGVDVAQYQFNADGDSLTMNIGNGANVGSINADSVSGAGEKFNVNIGDDATINGELNGPNGAVVANYNVGDGVTITNNVFGSQGAHDNMVFGVNTTIGGALIASGQGDTNLSIGDDSTIGNSIDLRGIGDRTFDLGNNVRITGNLDVRATGNHTMTAGDNLFVSNDINFDGGASSDITIGRDLEVGRNFVTTASADTLVIGNAWDIGGNLDVISGDDNLKLGFQDPDSPLTVVFGGAGTDGLTVAVDPTNPAGFIAAATAAGFVDNGDGTVSGSPSATFFAFNTVVYRSWETNAICFVAGTQIKVADDAAENVEDLRQGDMVLTADRGLQEIKWINSITLSGEQLIDNLRPVRIRAGALGVGLPSQDLVVSPQHRMVVSSNIARKMSGADEVLIAARHLTVLDGIEVLSDIDEVTYVHFLCDQHEIVFACDAPSETLFTGPQALRTVTGPARIELLKLFPELSDMDYEALSARPIVKGQRARNMAERHKRNARTLLAR